MCLLTANAAQTKTTTMLPDLSRMSTLTLTGVLPAKITMHNLFRGIEASDFFNVNWLISNIDDFNGKNEMGENILDCALRVLFFNEGKPKHKEADKIVVALMKPPVNAAYLDGRVRSIIRILLEWNEILKNPKIYGFVDDTPINIFRMPAGADGGAEVSTWPNVVFLEKALILWTRRDVSDFSWVDTEEIRTFLGAGQAWVSFSKNNRRGNITLDHENNVITPNQKSVVQPRRRSMSNGENPFEMMSDDLIEIFVIESMLKAEDLRTLCGTLSSWRLTHRRGSMSMNSESMWKVACLSLINPISRTRFTPLVDFDWLAFLLGRVAGVSAEKWTWNLLFSMLCTEAQRLSDSDRRTLALSPIFKVGVYPQNVTGEIVNAVAIARLRRRMLERGAYMLDSLLLSSWPIAGRRSSRDDEDDDDDEEDDDANSASVHFSTLETMFLDDENSLRETLAFPGADTNLFIDVFWDDNAPFNPCLQIAQNGENLPDNSLVPLHVLIASVWTDRIEVSERILNDYTYVNQTLPETTFVSSWDPALLDKQIVGKRTALMYAAENANIDLVDRFLKMGADVNAVDILGNTALMLAASYSSTSPEDDEYEGNGRPAVYDFLIKIIMSLMQAGANVNVVNALDGNTSALSKAIRYRNVEMIVALKAAGAEVSDEDRLQAMASKSPELISAVN